ncbi:MAG: YraN family protein [Dehalococcoidia bacterium]
MFKDRKTTGAVGEKQAEKFLKKQGYKIIETNYRCKLGEIDIVARDKDTIVFAEVRTKHNLEYGTPEESVNSAKQAKLIKLAEYYMQQHQGTAQFWRIDVVAVEMGERDKISRIEIIKNAVAD